MRHEKHRFTLIEVMIMHANMGVRAALAGVSVNFSIKGLSPDIAIAAVVDANGQTVTVGANHPATTTMLAKDYNTSSSGYRKSILASVFSEASLPAATSADDLTTWV